MSKRKLLITGLVVTLSIIAPIGWLIIGDAIQERLHRQRFVPVLWQGPKSSFTNDVRIRMVDDLLRRYHLRGMTRKQLTAIIGEPDVTEYFKEWDMVYRLGPERGFISIDSEWLVIRLDSQKEVADYRIVED